MKTSYKYKRRFYDDMQTFWLVRFWGAFYASLGGFPMEGSSYKGLVEFNNKCLQMKCYYCTPCSGSAITMMRCDCYIVPTDDDEHDALFQWWSSWCYFQHRCSETCQVCAKLVFNSISTLSSCGTVVSNTKANNPLVVSAKCYMG